MNAAKGESYRRDGDGTDSQAVSDAVRTSLGPKGMDKMASSSCPAVVLS